MADGLQKRFQTEIEKFRELQKGLPIYFSLKVFYLAWN